MPRRFRSRFRINGPLLLAILALVGGISLYVAFPWLATSPTAAESRLPVPETSPPILEIIRERGITCVTGLWFFVFGATIGSFLNVVAYRMPMGLSFVAKPSRCPYCETRILFRHNVPIFGWLALQGRCHACRLPISIRYPLVELVVGSLFFLLFARELASGGTNLPLELARTRPGIMWNVLSPNWPLLGLYFFHAYLIGILATIALIKFDRLRIPARLVGFTIVLGLVLRISFSALTVVPWWSPFAMPGPVTSPWQRILGPGLDLVVGLLLGWAAHCVIESQRPRSSTNSTSGSFCIVAIVGTYLGWQVLVPLLILAVLIQFFTMLIGHWCQKNSSVMWAASYLWATVLLIGLWKHLPALGLPSAESSLMLHWYWLFVSLVATYLTAKLSIRRLSL